MQVPLVPQLRVCSNSAVSADVFNLHWALQGFCHFSSEMPHVRRSPCNQVQASCVAPPGVREAKQTRPLCSPFASLRFRRLCPTFSLVLTLGAPQQPGASGPLLPPAPFLCPWSESQEAPAENERTTFRTSGTVSMITHVQKNSCENRPLRSEEQTK